MYRGGIEDFSYLLIAIYLSQFPIFSFSVPSTNKLGISKFSPSFYPSHHPPQSILERIILKCPPSILSLPSSSSINFRENRLKFYQFFQ
ncbi:unnamed protein product [Meloidogyne enterolobii]|uniref:Uncharacterized protein n=1 Tax=Meloidogyne enterolobii TaxID=390850 RepID=A0ACB0YGM1_MELEN